MVTRIFLLTIALMFFAFGGWSIVDPLGMTSQLGVQVTGPAGAFEIRGVYGGISLGAALLCLAGGLKPDLERPALYFLVAYMGGYILGRGASLIAGDTALSTSWGFAGFEAIVFALAVLLLRTPKK
ncbi:MAG: DUF4345 family protein [Pseudomonadota bacterium]